MIADDPKNPYMAPSVEVSKTVASGGVHQKDGMLLVPLGSELPDVCLITGRRSTGRHVEKTFTWAPGWVYIFILFNLLVLLIVYLIVRKQGKLKYYLDHEVLAKISSVTRNSWLTFAGLVVLEVVGIVQQIPLLIGVPILGSLILLIVALVRLPRLTIAKIDKQFIYLKKVHPDAVERILAVQG